MVFEERVLDEVAAPGQQFFEADMSLFATTLGEGQESVLLDPSLFLGDGGFEWLADVSSDERQRFVVSSTFFEQIAGRIEYTATDTDLWGPLPNEEFRGQLAELLAGFTMFSQGDAATELPPEVAEIADQLRDMGSQVAVEQWLYLHSNSWIAARSRRILDHFTRAGAKGVELVGNAVDDLTWLALLTRPDGAGRLTARLRLKAGVNVVVVGGVATVGVLVPWLVVPGAIVTFIYSTYAKPSTNPAAR